MKAPEWNQKVLLYTHDDGIKRTISSTFNDETDLAISNSSQEAHEYLAQHKVHVFIIDITSIQKDSQAGQIDLKDLCKKAHLTNGKITLILLGDLDSLIKDLGKKFDVHLVLDRNDINLDKMLYVIRVLRKRTFRTVVVSDIEEDYPLDIDLYTYIPLSNRYLVFLRAGETLTLEKRLKLYETNINQLFVQGDELKKYIKSIEKSPSIKGGKIFLSQRLDQVRKKYREFLKFFFDQSSFESLNAAESILNLGYEIIDDLNQVVDAFEEPTDCLDQLPFLRFSTIGHGVNCAIYSLIFSFICQIKNKKAMAFAALIHNIGHAEIPQNLIFKNELEMTESEIINYRQHLEKGLKLVEDIGVELTETAKTAMETHHENIDGTGYPNGLSNDEIPLEGNLLSILGCYDYFRTARPGKAILSPQEAWIEVKKYNHLGKNIRARFHPTLIQSLDEFFKQYPSTT